MDEDLKALLIAATIAAVVLTATVCGCNAYKRMSFNDAERQRVAEFEYQKWMVEQGMFEAVEAIPGEPTIIKVWKKVGE